MAFNLQTCKSNINSDWLSQEREDWTRKHLSARGCLFYLRTHSWCVITHSVRVGVGESVDFVYLREKWNAGVAYIKTDSPIWKQSSNVSWKHRYVMVQATSRLCQHQYFLSRLAIDVNLTGLMYIKFLPSSLQVVSFWEFAIRWVIISLFPLTDSDDPKCNVIGTQTQRTGRALSVSPPPTRKFRSLAAFTSSEGQYPVWRDHSSDSLILRAKHTGPSNSGRPPWMVWWVKDLIFLPE